MNLWSEPDQMEPLFPARSEALAETTVLVGRKAAALAAGLPSQTCAAVADVIRNMNSYYSNLIEGHHTRPHEIERALREEYAKDKKTRDLQLLHRAHIETSRLLQQRLQEQPQENICSAAFLCWIHRELYQRIPAKLRSVQDKNGHRMKVQPGELRTQEVEVGNHIAPTFKRIGGFMTRFAEAYSPAEIRTSDQLVAAAAAHHRFTWIHPFLDGNGRVARLFTEAFLVRAGVASHGLWSISRGMARRQQEYRSLLANADAQRRNNYDGRGNLSAKGLFEFCSFFLDLCLDQIEFIGSLLELNGLQKRLLAYADWQAANGQFKREAGYLLRDVLLRGSVPRGEAGRILGMHERSARNVVRTLTGRNLLRSDTPKGPLRSAFPIAAVGYLFPHLYPGEVLLD